MTNKSECILPINGILLLNKPQGLSSNAVLQKAKRLFKARKAGHTGSLDPLATGMLPICFGEATKLSQYLLDADKCYEATGLLGIKTSTADSMGEVLEQMDEFHISEAQLRDALQQFTGLTQQTPSMFSALKHQGQPLYKLARAGISVERKAREILIDALSLRSFDGRSFEITVSCSKGTYIRNLVEDIGDTLGVYAHVTQLHRKHTAGFDQEPMYTLESLQEMTESERLACLLPMQRAIPSMPELRIEHVELTQLQQGRTLDYRERQVEQGLVRLSLETGEFAGIGEIDADHVLKVKRLLAW
ncbi:tRNA pseudouridine(55) synthase TruB [Legionella sp. CNM-4043-24]|uniref:tRNA pseudouridine(55) synthase TruB n=1 Tax=Legionella sp. CNM-4043-24 TaxID=3421646 RepID=UPI00403AE906